MKHLEKFENYNNSGISESVKYHLNNKISFTKNVFRTGSKSFYSLLEEVRELYENGKLFLEGLDKELYQTTDIGKFATYKGQKVPLDIPMINEAEYNGREVELNKPMRSPGPKKYQVYVRNPDTGNVIKVNFGDEKGGLRVNINDPDARKAFAARHDCENKKDKTTAGYWSCRLPKFADSLGLSGGGNYYW